MAWVKLESASSARDQGFDDLANRVERQESGGNQDAVSPKGAFGVMQLMPDTARDPGFGVRPLDPNAPDAEAENRRLGRDYLAAMQQRYSGDVEAALAAYNWGPGNADKWVADGKPWGALPQETQGYITNIMGGRGPAFGAIGAQPEDPSGQWVRLEESMEEPQAPAVPSSGVTIAAKGQAPREATPEEAGQVDYIQAGAGDIASKAAENFVPSAKQFGSDMLSIVTDPVGTAQSIGKVAAGGVSKLIPGDQGYEEYADAVGQFFVDRYGSVEAAKRTMAEDPVGFLADVSTVMTGGQLALARAPGVAGRVGRVAGQAANTIDPIGGSLKAVGAAGNLVGRGAAEVLGVTTGAGGDTIRRAAQTGAEGGEAGRVFRENMRGNVPLESVIDDATSALSAVRAERSAAYKAGMVDVTADSTVLNFGRVQDALNNTKADFSFKGMEKNPKAMSALRDVATKIDAWQKLDPAEFHTAAGFDALKQQLNAIQESIPYEQRSARKAVGQVRDVISDQIKQQAPSYAKTMKDYQVASDLITEIEKTLSLKPNANVDTQLRKLQSVMRNNVSTNYGRRGDLVKLLEEKGATNIMNKLAGQQANAWAPRGLARAVAAGQGALAGYGAVSAMNPAALAAAVPGLAVQSPRLVSEAAHMGGRVTNALSPVPVRNALQAGFAVRGSDQR
ncbi:MAG: lytic transglycosylase domain-containing protein [Pseudomonadota bacterium]